MAQPAVLVNRGPRGGRARPVTSRGGWKATRIRPDGRPVDGPRPSRRRHDMCLKRLGERLAAACRGHPLTCELPVHAAPLCVNPSLATRDSRRRRRDTWDRNASQLATRSPPSRTRPWTAALRHARPNCGAITLRHRDRFPRTDPAGVGRSCTGRPAITAQNCPFQRARRRPFVKNHSGQLLHFDVDLRRHDELVVDHPEDGRRGFLVGLELILTTRCPCLRLGIHLSCSDGGLRSRGAPPPPGSAP